MARELGIKESTLGRWVHDFRAKARPARPAPAPRVTKLDIRSRAELTSAVAAAEELSAP